MTAMLTGAVVLAMYSSGCWAIVTDLAAGYAGDWVN